MLTGVQTNPSFVPRLFWRGDREKKIFFFFPSPKEPGYEAKTNPSTSGGKKVGIALPEGNCQSHFRLNDHSKSQCRDGRSFSYELRHRMQYTMHPPVHAVNRTMHLWWCTTLGTTGDSAVADDGRFCCSRRQATPDSGE